MQEHISHDEFKKVMNTLHDKMPRSKLDKVRMSFAGQLDDSSVSPGVTRKEFDAQMKYFEKNPSHGFSKQDLGDIKEAFGKHF